MSATITEVSAPTAPSRFLTQLLEAARRHGHAEPAAAELVNWCRRFILFHGTKHPQEMGQLEVNAYLRHVAQTTPDPLRPIAAAHGALEFLYHIFLQRQLGEIPWPKPPRLLDQVMQAMRVKHHTQGPGRRDQSARPAGRP